MHETDFSYSEISSPPPGTELAAGPHVLRGWVWPKAGGHFVNVRARAAGKVFAGIHGYPRADLAEKFPTGRRQLLAEFSVVVHLPPGEGTVSLEVLGLDGRWTVFQTVVYAIRGALPPPSSLPAIQSLRWHDFNRGLEFLLRTRRARPGVSWTRLATELAAELPVHQDLLPPVSPFIGHGDEPAMANSSRFGLLPVVGTLFHPVDRIAKLWVSAELQTLQPLILGRSTPNLVTQFPQFPNAVAAGYEGYVDVPPTLPNPVALRIYVENEAGDLQLAQVRTTRRHDAELEKLPYANPTPEDFQEAVNAWRSALRVRGFRLEMGPEVEPELARLGENYARREAPLPAAATRPSRPLRHAILVSHNLNLEGAPLFLLDLAHALNQAGIALTLLSPADGALRPRFEASGTRVVIVDVAPFFHSRTAAEADAALTTLGQAFDFASGDLVITNTFTTFWAVHAARKAGQRILSYVHESTTPAAFYRQDLAPDVVALAGTALVAADAVSFTSNATRRYHAWPGRAVHAVLTPGWVDLAAVDSYRAAHPREMLRARLGVAPQEILVTNVATICDRKGQLGFARAVDLFNRRHPQLAARTRFVLLGGREAYFDRLLGAVLGRLALPNLVIHPETPDFLGYYLAADLTVCSSHEESSPRVVFEAMACGTPLLASDIPGISEIARDGIEATLVPAGHPIAWAEALAHVLTNLDEARNRAKLARTRIESDFAASVVLPRHLALARAIAAGQPVA